MAITTQQAQELGNEFDSRTEQMLVNAELGRYMGTTILDPIQNEVNGFHERLDAMTKLPDVSYKRAQNDMQATVLRTEAQIQSIQDEQFNSSVAGFGSVTNRMSMGDVPSWNEALMQVSAGIETIGGRYASLISNQPDRESIDSSLAEVLTSLEAAFEINPSPAGAKAAVNTATGMLTNIEQELARRLTVGKQESLSNLIQMKDMQRLEVISTLKMHEALLTDSEKQVVLMHDTKATEMLISMKTNVNNYDKAILNQNLRTLDTILAPLLRLRESVQYRAALSGGQFATPRRPSTKTHGWGNIPKRRYHEGQLGSPTNRSPFRGAPDTTGVRGGRGLGSTVMGESADTQMKALIRVDGALPEPFVVIETLNENIEIGIAQGFITPADEAILRDQLTAITIDVFAGDQQLFDQSKIAYKNTIERLSKAYVDKIKSGAIEGRLPPEESSKYPEGFTPTKSFMQRLGVTVGGITLLTVAGVLGIGYALAKRDSDKGSVKA